MDEQFADILHICLAQLDAGASVDACLTVYPRHSAVLEPALRAAAQLRAFPRPTLPAATRTALEAKMVALAAARRNAAAPTPTSNGHAPSGWQSWRTLAPSSMPAGILRALGYRGSLSQPFLRLATAAIAVVLAFVLATGVFAAARALLKAVTASPTTPTPIMPAVTPFALDGPIEQLAPTTWVVNGVSIVIDAQTSITGSPTIGARAHITGNVTADGTLLARTIAVAALQLSPTSIPPTPIPPTPTSIPTPLPAPPVPTVAPQPSPKPKPPKPPKPSKPPKRDDEHGDEDDEGGD